MPNEPTGKNPKPVGKLKYQNCADLDQHKPEEIQELEIISFSECDELLRGFSENLNKYTSLKSLTINLENVSKDVWQEFSKALEPNEYIKSLTIEGRLTAADTLSVILDALGVNHVVDTLGLRSSDLSDSKKIKWVDELPKAHSLKHLNLYGCGELLNRENSDLVEAICKDMHLVSLNLSGCRSSNALKEVCSIIEENKCLQHLGLSANLLNDGMVGQLCSCVKLNPESKLRSLDLAHNLISRVGTEAICNALKNKLRSLDLSYNLIDGESMGVICEAFKDNSNLVSLSVAHNKISQTNLVSYLTDITKCQNLRIINMKCVAT